MHTYANLFGKAAKYFPNKMDLLELAIGAWETESLIGNGFRPYGLGINMATKF